MNGEGVGGVESLYSCIMSVIERTVSGGMTLAKRMYIYSAFAVVPAPRGCKV